MLWFIINRVADLLKWLIAPFCYCWGFVHSIKKKEFSQWHKDLALVKDVYGNILIKYPANTLLIKKEGYKFGQLFDTISKVLGINKKDKTLTGGKVIADFLNTIDPNHVEDAIKIYYENRKNIQAGN